LNTAYQPFFIGFTVQGAQRILSNQWSKNDIRSKDYMTSDVLSASTRDMLQRFHKGDRKVLNVFFKSKLAEEAEIVGKIVKLPAVSKDFPSWADSVLIDSHTLPGVSNKETYRNMRMGKTLVHEVGHW
jgi:hypothetical protein